MAKLRYVKTLEQVKKAAEANPEFMSSTIRSIRCVYETDPEIVNAITPKPLVPVERPEICVTFSHVAMHITPDFTFEIGSAIFGTKVTYDGVEGVYLVTMPMTTEQAVVPGRETFGEPKKIAQIDFEQEGDRVSSRVARMGMPAYLEVDGTLGASTGPREFTEYGFCYKAFPSCEAGGTFDTDPLLVQLEWKHSHEDVRTIENGDLTLRDSMFDPVADVPVRKLVSLEYEVGTTQSNGKVLRSIPGDWLLPFFHQRYDDTSGDGIEL
ncbi:MAG: acetoacetate decarboxylase family protein [Myxococcota bacterium]|nr:acetoacetate decarboxylase family protein [Myxococcota bacterium]NRA74888.1 acetoacetate decarboxylase family protein [Planctomycetota bacterium]